MGAVACPATFLEPTPKAAQWRGSNISRLAKLPRDSGNAVNAVHPERFNSSGLAEFPMEWSNAAKALQPQRFNSRSAATLPTNTGTAIEASR